MMYYVGGIDVSIIKEDGGKYQILNTETLKWDEMEAPDLSAYMGISADGVRFLIQDSFEDEEKMQALLEMI